MGALFILLPSEAGDVSPSKGIWPLRSIGDGGVMSSGTGAHDPSAPAYGGTSPASLGRRMKSAPMCE